MSYVEPPRGYASLLVTVAVLATAMGLDAEIGGLADHAIAWVVVVVVLVGVHALMVHASRVNKTLTITDDEVRIGDEVLLRSDLAAASADVTDVDLPVLGWPTGAPAKVNGVTVRLTDARQAIVPTKKPDEVMAALGLAPQRAVEVREATEDDLPLLAEIDERAETLFRVAGMVLPASEDDEWETAAAIFVVGEPPVGFARVDVVDGSAHLTEVSVLPGSMKRGFGARLIDACCSWAADAGYDAITLTTYADVAWNGPMYARRGWVESTALGSELAAIREREAASGLDDAGRRIAMRREL